VGSLGNYDIHYMHYNLKLESLKLTIIPQIEALNETIRLIHFDKIFNPLIFFRKKRRQEKETLIKILTERKDKLSEEFNIKQKEIAEEFNKSCRESDGEFWEEIRNESLKLSVKLNNKIKNHFNK